MLLNSVDDIGEVLSQAIAHNGLILAEKDLSPSFLDLRTGIAGELFQKIVNYHSRLAIVISDPGVYGERISELVHEHRHHPTIRFFKHRADAEHWLTEFR